MAEIKISDLSVGDWVRVDDFDKVLIKRVSAIDGTRNQIGIIKNNRGGIYWYYEDEIEPIPLTPEILEKNGFVKGKIYEGNSSIVFTNGNISISWFKKSKWYRLRIYNALGDTELCSVIVHNVHQLQHALRLAGVGKEIEV